MSQLCSRIVIGVLASLVVFIKNYIMGEDIQFNIINF